MKIADFFIALGFDIKGAPDVDKAQQSVQKLELGSIKLLAVVGGLNAAFYAMMTKAVEAGTALQKFALTTGLSTDELQKWELAAAKGNVAAGEMTNAIGAIQKARAAIAFGNAEAAAPWMLLGIDPRQDPFKVLEQLRLQVLKLDPAIAKQKLSEMGFGDNMLYLMKQPGFGQRGANDQRMIINPEEQERLSKLGAAWKEFLLTVDRVLTKFAASAFAETLTEIVKQLTGAVKVLGAFANWLEKGSDLAWIVTGALIALAVAMTGIGLAAGVLMLGPFGVFAATILIMAAALGTLVFLIQDFWVACRGGKSAFDWNDNLILSVKNVEALSLAITVLLDTWDRLVIAVKSGKGVLNLLGDIGRAAQGDASGLVGAALMDKNSLTNQNIQTNHINVTVPAGGDAHATGHEVGKGASRQISDAFGQLPLPSR